MCSPGSVKLMVTVAGHVMTPAAAPQRGSSATARSLLDLVHTDICGPIKVPSANPFRCSSMFIDDYSNLVALYRVWQKSDFKKPGLILKNDSGTKLVDSFNQFEVINRERSFHSP